MPEGGENVNFDLLAAVLRPYFQAVSSIAAPMLRGGVASKLTNIEPVGFVIASKGWKSKGGSARLSDVVQARDRNSW